MALRTVRFPILLLSGLFAGGLPGCFSGLPGINDPIDSSPLAARLLRSGRSAQETTQPLTAPSKDEVALVDGRPFSISGFMALRKQLNNRSTESVLWIGTGVLAIQNAVHTTGQELDTGAAVEIARYGMGEIGADLAGESLRRYFTRASLPPTPQEVRSEIDRLLALSVVRRNDHLVAQLASLNP